MPWAVMPNLMLLGPVCINPFQRPPANRNSEREQQDRTARPRFRSRRTVALLGYLAAERRPVGRDFLSSFFWPNETHSHGRACLRRELYNLGQILPNCWEMDRQKVVFDPDQDMVVDVYYTLDLMEQERWAEASGLLGGDFLEGIILDNNPEFELWLLSERDRWRIRSEEIYNHVIQAQKLRGRYSEALHHTRRLLKLSPWDESAHQTAMRLLAWTGKRGAALRQFENCKRILGEELNVEPADETLILYREILEGELDPPPQLPAFLTAERPRHKFELPVFVGRQAELNRMDHYLNLALGGEGQVVFITGGPGRGKTALLDNFTQRAMKQHPGLLVASGKCNTYSGEGDPFLPFRDLMGMLTGDVERLWDSGAINREHALRIWNTLPTVIQILLEHGRQLIGTFLPGDELLSRAVNLGEVETSWAPRLRRIIAQQTAEHESLIQSYLFEQVTRVVLDISRTQPLVLILDDLQWADPASVSLLFHLGRDLRNTHARILVVGAYRPEEIEYQDSTLIPEKKGPHPLAKVLSEFKRIFGDVWIDLSHSKADQERVFIDDLLDTEPNDLQEDFRKSLYSRTEGHPLFTVELLRALRERGDLLLDANQRWIVSSPLNWDLFPVRVEAVIEDRINRLNPDLQEILETASIEGEIFTAQVLAIVLGNSEKAILHTLSHDLERKYRLVKEAEEVYTKRGRISRFRFGHALFQEYLYQRICAGEQRFIHGEVAKALEDIHQVEPERIAGQLALHFYLADNWEKACHYYAEAADRASKLFANDEVLSYYSRAIKLVDRVSHEDDFLVRLHRGRGLVLERMGEFERALSDHHSALQLARSADNLELEWICLIDLGRLWAFRNFQRTREYFEKAIMLAREMDDPLALASSMNWMGNWYMNMEIPRQATTYHLEALQIAESIGDKQELANTLDLLGVLKLMEGNQKAGMQYYDRAISLQREMNDHVRLVSSLTGRAGTVMTTAFLATLPVCSLSQANDDLIEALQLADETGSTTGESWTLYMQGILDLVRGQFGYSLANFLRGLKLASDVNHFENMIANHFGVGGLYLEMFEPEQAIIHAENALILAEELHSPAMVNNTIPVLSGALLQLEDPVSAQSCLEKVLSPDTPMDTIGKRYCWVRQAELEIDHGKPEKAIQIIEDLISSSPGMKVGQVITYLWKLKADALTAMYQAGVARPLLLDALKSAQENGEKFLIWKIHNSQSKVYQELNQKSNAERERRKAQESIQELADTITDEKLKTSFLQSAVEKLNYADLQV